MGDIICVLKYILNFQLGVCGYSNKFILGKEGWWIHIRVAVFLAVYPLKISVGRLLQVICNHNFSVMFPIYFHKFKDKSFY